MITDNKAKINVHLMCAMHVAAGSHDYGRNHLSSVCLDVEKNQVTYWATTGHIALVYREEYPDEDNTLLGRFVIPIWNLRGQKTTKTKQHGYLIEKDKKLFFDYIDKGFYAHNEDAEAYPDMARIFSRSFKDPDDIRRGAFSCDFSALAKIGRKMKVSGVGAMRISYKKGLTASITFSNNKNMYGIFMPVFDKKDDSEPPEWLKNMSVKPIRLLGSGE